MKLENTIFANCQLVIDSKDRPVAFMKDGAVTFKLNDIVRVTDDGYGYICPGIHHSGIGRIIEIRRDYTDHFFGVLMENGEFGYMKDSRMRHC